MSRARICTIGLFALLLALAPFVPRGEDDDKGAITPSAQAVDLSAATAGPTRLTPDLRAEIDAVVSEGRRVSAGLGRRAAWTPRALASALVRCAELEGQRYCLGAGWTHRSEREVREQVAAAAARRTPGRERTGDADTYHLLRRTAQLPAARRAALERAELVQAARSVAKVWLLRHQVEGVPLPAGFLARHPEVRTTQHARSSSSAASARPRTWKDYPRRRAILDPSRARAQVRTYWCGPATMQSIAWNWSKQRRKQSTWARRLGTTTAGSAISEMVRVTNRYTGWDRTSYAGPYIVLDVGHYDYNQWRTLIARHIADYRAPVVLHPILLKRYYPYLDDDASGHFQVGRGYRFRPDKADQVGYFEPWNQQRFDPSEPFIDRVQWRSAYRSYRANLAHPHQNIGV